jgi:hypothetical protein
MNDQSVLNATNTANYWKAVIDNANYLYDDSNQELTEFQKAIKGRYRSKDDYISYSTKLLQNRTDEELSELSKQKLAVDKNDLLNKAGESTMTPLDILKGGIQYWISRKAADAPQVNLESMVDLERKVNTLRREELVNSLMKGTEEAYSNIEMYRAKRKVLNYKPQPYMEGIPSGKLAAGVEGNFGGGEVANTYQGMVGTAGKPSNQPNKFTSFRDYNIVTGRGRLGGFPISSNAILPETTISNDLDNAGILNAPF